MTNNSKIEWTTHTFNPWWGCARVSPACRSCYADTWASRWGHELWRRHGARRMLGNDAWRQPARWNRDAERAGVPTKVFCASMADVFEHHPEPTINAELNAARNRLWDLIEATPWLRWQLLTKRPENVNAMVPWGDCWPESVWLGVSAETQRWADTRIPTLVDTGAYIKFVSAEPLLGDIQLRKDWVGANPFDPHRTGIDWLIVGSESGVKARPSELEWFRSLREQCDRYGVAFFVKQLGTAWARERGLRGKADDISQFPRDLRIREFPVGDDAVVPA